MKKYSTIYKNDRCGRGLYEKKFKDGACCSRILFLIVLMPMAFADETKISSHWNQSETVIDYNQIISETKSILSATDDYVPPEIQKKMEKQEGAFIAFQHLMYHTPVFYAIDEGFTIAP